MDIKGVVPPEHTLEEIILSAQFAELDKLESRHFGEFHELIKRSFPFRDQKNRLKRIEETIPPKPKQKKEWRDFKRKNLDSRMLCASKTGDQMVQVQSDRFVYNQRFDSMLGDLPLGNQEYPVRAFLYVLGTFSQFVTENSIGDLKYDIVEATHYHFSEPPEGESVRTHMEKLLRNFSWNESADWMDAVPEHTHTSTSYLIAENKGRLYVEAAHSFDTRKKIETVAIKIVARVFYSGDVEHDIKLAQEQAIRGLFGTTTLLPHA